jgi:hypothetical protein
LTRHKQEGAARTHVRVSSETKKLLQDLQAKHGFDTIDMVLRFYLPADAFHNRPTFRVTKQQTLVYSLHNLHSLLEKRRHLSEEQNRLVDKQKELDRRIEVVAASTTDNITS